ncbi:MAG: TIGR03905 family TSCPD domain-containing protein [Clostridiales bacterium]|nr:TIGR03905 family TSCPD domain-containing protein [Clostridiales bacterium]
MKTIEYTPVGTCSRYMEIDVEDGVVKGLRVVGGCNGNLKGISALVVGMKVEDVIARLEGIKCGFKQTSCPDQIAQALKQAL